MLEKKTTKEIINERHPDCIKVWVSRDSLLNDLEETILKGNIVGGGFSSALWISDLKNRLEELKR